MAGTRNGARDSFHDDWEEPTRNDMQSPAVRDLSDPDMHVMLGKMARAVADTQAEVRNLVQAWRSERRSRSRARRREGVLTVGAVGVIQASLAILHQLGVLK